MPIELQLLVWATALTVLQSIIALLAAMPQVGLPRLAGNREGMAEWTGWAGRAQRAHRNMLESLAIFAVLVLVGQATNHLNASTVLGAQLWFWARVVYAIVYTIGLPWVRSAVWGVSVAGLVMIFSQLV